MSIAKVLSQNVQRLNKADATASTLTVTVAAAALCMWAESGGDRPARVMVQAEVVKLKSESSAKAIMAWCNAQAMEAYGKDIDPSLEAEERVSALVSALTAGNRTWADVRKEFRKPRGPNKPEAQPSSDANLVSPPAPIAVERIIAALPYLEVSELNRLAVALTAELASRKPDAMAA